MTTPVSRAVDNAMNPMLRSALSALSAAPGPVFYYTAPCPVPAFSGTLDIAHVSVDNAHPAVLEALREADAAVEAHPAHCAGTLHVEKRQIGQRLPKDAIVFGLVDADGELHLASTFVPFPAEQCPGPVILTITVPLTAVAAELLQRPNTSTRDRYVVATYFGGSTWPVQLARTITFDAGELGRWTYKSRIGAHVATGVFARMG